MNVALNWRRALTTLIVSASVRIQVVAETRSVVIMVALWNRADHYIFILFLLSSSCFSSPNLSGRRLDVYHTSTHGVALVRI